MTLFSRSFLGRDRLDQNLSLILVLCKYLMEKKLGAIGLLNFEAKKRAENVQSVCIAWMDVI